MPHSMDTTLFSDENRIDRGDSLLFHCVQLSQGGTDSHRYFFGCYFPRWRGFYMDEARELPGPLGYNVTRHFPAFPFDVYLKDDGEHFLTDDFQIGSIFTLGGPLNQRDDEQKRYKVVHCDDSQLRTRTGKTLASIGNNVSGLLQQTHRVSGEAIDALKRIREAYIFNVGNGIPEVGIKAMGRHFRKVGSDGRRWMSYEGIVRFVKDSRNFNATLSFSDTQRTEEDVNTVATCIYNAFPQNEEECIDYDFFMDYVRGPMSQERKDAVWNIFRRMDYDRDGNLNIIDIQACYNTQEHPTCSVDHLFQSDKMLKGFLTIWDENERCGLVPYAEFLDYYNGVSAVLEDDKVFFDVLNNQWKLL
ncbi:calcium-binding protein [Trypanosoma brucei equiperdum]|uniref:Calcium-binding protein n=1 Tax=Trypanosoma brucei equiperdum TaxID=630700 RepID=A0A3L6L812_9TRYP|nr:calcium-binding protein [Trypanosoma brucei equiperdum]